MLQLWSAKCILRVLTGLAAIIAFSSYFGVASRVNATEVRHPTHQHDQGDWLVPTGKGWGQFDSSGMSFSNAQRWANKHGGKNGAGSTNNGIFYHGGPVIIQPKDVYFIWYGNWSGNSATSILTDFGNNIGGSNYFNINSTYTDGNGNAVTNVVTLSGQTTDSYSLGNNLSDADIQSIVTNAIPSLGGPDVNGVYFVLTSADVNETSGFCTMYCGWHTHASIAGDIKYAFVGDPTRCPTACEVQTTGPNGSSGADGMANIIAHELAEAATDPDLNAWYDHRGYENADKCAWKFGSTTDIKTASNGSLYNVELTDGSNWLLQQNWVNANGGGCTLAYP